LNAQQNNDENCWYVLRVTYQRELKAKEILDGMGIHCYVPVTKDKKKVKGRLKEKIVPVLHNYIFVYSTKAIITSIKQEQIHYLRYVMSNSDEGNREPMVVPSYQMENFLLVTCASEKDFQFYIPSEVNLKKGDKVRVLGGIFAGLEGKLVKLKKEKFKRVVVEIEGLIGVVTDTLPPELVEKI